MNPAQRRRIGRMEEVSDRCCRPHRPTTAGARKEERALRPRKGREFWARRTRIMRGAPSSHTSNAHRTTHQSAAPGGGREEEGRVRKEEEFGGGIRRRRRRRRKKTRKRAKAPLRVRPLGTRHSRRLERSIVEEEDLVRDAQGWSRTRALCGEAT